MTEMQVQTYRRIPDEVDAVQWTGATGEDAEPLIHWVAESENWTAVWRAYRPYDSGGLFPQEAQDRIEEGIYVRMAGAWREVFVAPGDYLLRTHNGFEACKQLVFEAQYEPLSG